MKCIECKTNTRFGDLKYGVCPDCRQKIKESLDGSLDIQSNEGVTKVSNGVNSNAIQTLKGFSQLVLVVGVFISLAISIASLRSEEFFFLIYAMAFFIVTLLQWAFIQVFAEMAEDIRAIRYKS